MAKEEKTLAERMKETRAKILAQSKDSRHMNALLDELIGLYRKRDIRPMELEVPVSEVKESMDLGPIKISRTIRGILLEAKGGMYTFVESRMSKVYGMFSTIFDMEKTIDDEKTDEETRSYLNSLMESMLYVFQAPIFASMDTITLLGIATAILKEYNEFGEERYTNADVHEETEEDIKENNELESAASAIDILSASDNRVEQQ